MSNLNCCLKSKVQGQKHPGGWGIVELLFKIEGSGTKNPGRWGIVEHQIPSIKVLFKTNTKSHKHSSWY